MNRTRFLGLTLLLLALAILGRLAMVETLFAAQQAAVQVEDIKPQLAAIKAWSDQLKGMPIDELKKVFGSAVPAESTWAHDDQGGPKLSYEFPNCDVVLYCTDETVVLVSIDFLPE